MSYKKECFFGHCPNDLSSLSPEASGLVKLTSLPQNQGVQKMNRIKLSQNVTLKLHVCLSVIALSVYDLGRWPFLVQRPQTSSTIVNKYE